jgi:hypothetical protein
MRYILAFKPATEGFCYYFFLSLLNHLLPNHCSVIDSCGHTQLHTLSRTALDE